LDSRWISRRSFSVRSILTGSGTFTSPCASSAAAPRPTRRRRPDLPPGGGRRTTSRPMANLPRFLPHSILDRDYWTNLANRPHLAPVLREIESLAASAGSRPPLPSASDYLRARRYTDRNTVDIEWQETRGVLSALIVRRCLLG